jgi:methionyl-tRNA formyltransferase
MKLRKNIIKETAEQISNTDQNKSFITTPPSLRLTSKKYATEATMFQTWLEKKKPDLLVVIAYGKIIPQHILDIPAIAPINVHGSLLPEYRGASPIQSVFLDGKIES